MPVRKGNSVEFLSANDAHLLRKQRNLTHCRSLYGLIEFVEKHIHFKSSDGSYDTIVNIPPFSTDLPAYNVIELTDELELHFADQGYYVRRVGPRVLYLSWRYPRKAKR